MGIWDGWHFPKMIGKIPKNDSISFLGAFDIRMTCRARHPLSGKDAGCSRMGGFAKDEEEKF